MIRISNISFFRFCWKNGKLDWPKCARTCVPEGFFSCCLRRKLSDEAAVVTSGFFSRSSRSRLRRQTTGKKNPLAPRVSYQLPSLYNVYKEKPIFQNISKKHVHVIFPVLILFVQSTHMERILTGLGGLVWKILHASGNIQLRACFQAQKKSTSLVSVFGTYVKTERLKKLKSLPRGLMVLKYS